MCIIIAAYTTVFSVCRYEETQESDFGNTVAVSKIALSKYLYAG
jgi:hypothetical protein